MRFRRLWLCVTALLIAARTPGAAQSGSAAGDSAWTRGDHETARQHYLLHVAQAGDDPVALFRLGLIAGWAGHGRESLAWFDRVLATSPEDRDARVARARTLAAMGEVEAAIASVDSILVLHPHEVSALNARARFAGWRGDFTESERLWRTALEHDTANVETRLGLAQVLRWKGRSQEARRVIAPALAAEPDNAELRLENDRVQQTLRPRARSTLALEDDSDGNTITTFAMAAAARAGEAIEIRGDAWVRHASFSPAAADAGIRGGTLNVAVRLASGWSVAAGAGASTTDAAGSGSVPTAGLSVTSPPGHPVALTVAANRSAFDYTEPLARNRVVVGEASASVDLRSGRDWAVSMRAAAASFDVRRSGEGNARLSAEASAIHRFSEPLSVALAARAFGFDRDVDGGYFDPAFYGLADTALRLRAEDTHWSVDAEAAPGLQMVGTGGRASGAFRASASASWSARPGRTATLRGTWANTGLQRLAPGAGTGYRYASLALTVSWWF